MFKLKNVMFVITWIMDDHGSVTWKLFAADPGQRC